MTDRSPLWRTAERQAQRNGWARARTAAGAAGLVVVFDRDEEYLELHFGTVAPGSGIPFLVARYRPSRDATLITVSAPDTVLKILEAPRVERRGT